MVKLDGDSSKEKLRLRVLQYGLCTLFNVIE